ncbi:MAG: VWA domain-containing protein [Deltaproteobacteria bacterium]|uniref:VWA domain-containing protein n=1 Tax=Candidatus Zymogenus saltonus TaxID=2844893 RepID=A0A9D8KF24_9DELT|nr:VWA domain-containing protein [Candidatus Zymogenus saltonus]
MKSAILDFIEGLKFRGARVSISESMDALTGVSVVGTDDRGAFKAALRATLVKDGRDIPAFEELFEAYFSPMSIIEAARLEMSPVEERLQQLMDELVNGKFTDQFKGMIQGDIASMMEMVLASAEEAGLSDIRYQIQTGYFYSRILTRMGGFGLDRQLDELIDLLAEKGAMGDGIEGDDIRAIFEERMEAMRELIRDLIKREERKHRGEKRETDLPNGLGDRSFSELTEKEIEEMRDSIKEMVKKIKDALSLRDRHRRRGRFDIKKTLRIAQQYGGVPIRVFFKKKKKNKGQIITLCDVSRSVWNASRFMLNLLYSLQDQFDRVRSFVFVSDLGEVTDVFNRYEINEAIGKLVYEAGINFYSYTDYGDVLLRFYNDYLDIVNRRTTVIIIGDARNNYMAHNSWVLDKIKGKARKVYWLNNEPESWWGSGDSDMPEFLPYVSEARECRNLKQLSRFIRDLVE